MRVGDKFCPGILHAVPAKDGLLLRIRVPGGILLTEQLRAIAHLSDAFADGWIEITSRANVQIRGVDPQNLPRIVDGMSSAGLLPSQTHDRVRNFVTSPFAGVDEKELMDPRPLLLELDRRVPSQDRLAGLHPKFSFAVYGGSKCYSPESDDVSLRAVWEDGKMLLEVSFAGEPMGFGVEPQHAVDLMITAANESMAMTATAGIAARMKNVLEIPNGLERLIKPLQQWLTPLRGKRWTAHVEPVPYGINAGTGREASSIVPCVPLGRLSARQAEGVASIVDACGGDLRLAPWRGFVIASVASRSVDAVVAELLALGMSLDGRDGYLGITACAGSEGCDASLADVRRDAATIARVLAGRPVMRDWSVNVSGCEKRCARRRGAMVDLVATVSGYDVKVAGETTSYAYPASRAIEAVDALHRTLVAEVVAR